ncbi:MAG: hypothetical protein WDO14_06295 [Bacteroidota bacterium]
MQLEGTVVSKIFGKGSKSEYQGVFLSTPQGDYVLRQHGNNPFDDPELKKLVGKNIVATGEIEEYIFFVDAVRVRE